MTQTAHNFEAYGRMIELYTWTTPNGRKISIALEEMGLDYKTHQIDIRKGDQHAEEFVKISPNHKLPVLVDGANVIFESGAILLYLADKTGQFIPDKNTPEYWETVSWLMWQKAAFGPILGQTHHFLTYHPGKAPFAAEHFSSTTAKLYEVLDLRLSRREFIMDEITIADFAIWPWVARFDRQKVDIGAYPNVQRWYEQLAKRDGFIKGYAQPLDVEAVPQIVSGN